ncbi:MAG: PKD domain-containing protein [Solirubrobacterales bacterium]
MLAIALAIGGGTGTASANEGHGYAYGWGHYPGHHSNWHWWWSHSHYGHCHRVPTPTAEFTADPAASFAGESVAFDASASTGGMIDDDYGEDTVGTLTKFEWSFGDGGTATESGPTVSHVFTDPGTYDVTLKVTNDGGKTASVSHSLVVSPQPAPTASFGVDPASPTATQAASFDGSGSSGGESNGRVGSVVDYAWDFGDGETASGADAVASHTFAEAGTFSVKLTVTNDYGQTDSVSQDVVVQSVPTPVPTAAFTISPASPVAGRPISFDGSNSSGGEDRSVTGMIVDYAWDFGDGTTQNGPTSGASHSYTDGGQFVVKLTVTNDAGQSDDAQMTLTVAPPPPPYDPGDGPSFAAVAPTSAATGVTSLSVGRSLTVSVSYSLALPEGSDPASACTGAANVSVSAPKQRKVAGKSALKPGANSCSLNFKLKLPKGYAGKKAKFAFRFAGNGAVAPWSATRKLVVK